MMLTENTSFMNIKAKLEGNLIKGHRSTVLHGQEAVEYQKKRQQEQDSIVPDPTTEITPKDRLTVTNLKVEHTENDPGTIKEELDKQTEQVGDHLYINPMLFPQLETNPFIQTDRVLPVEFPYPYKFTLLCKLALPEGYEVEELPQSQFIRAEGDHLQCRYMIQKQGNTILVSYRFHLKEYIFLPEHYKQLQDMWTKIIEKNHTLIVLKKI